MGLTDTTVMRVKLELEAKQLETKLQHVKTQMDSLGGGSALRLQQGFKGAASQAANFVGIFTGDRLTGATSQLTSLSGALGAMPGPAGLAVGAVAALTAAAAGGAVAIFNLTKAAAEYGSEIFDATQKTGLSAQTISALKYAAEQSGSSLEAITGSVSKFNVLLGEANQGNEKATATLKLYGITAKETDAALAQAIARITQMTDADQKAAAAKALFKDRTAEILPVLASFDGNLPALMDKLEKLGLLMSDEDARAADEFGDTLDTLTAQASATGRQFATELMPMMTSAMSEISRFMAENKGVAQEWGSAVIDTANGVAFVFEAVTGTVLISLNQISGGLINNESGWWTWSNVVKAAIEATFPTLTFFLDLLRQVGLATATPPHGSPQDSNTSTLFSGSSAFSFGGVRQPGRGGKGGGGGRGSGRDNSADKARREAEKAERERIAAAKQLYHDEVQLFAAQKAKELAIEMQYAQSLGKTEDDMARRSETYAMERLEARKVDLQQYLDALVKGTEAYERAEHEKILLDFEIEELRATHAKNEQERQNKLRETEKKRIQDNFDRFQRKMKAEDDYQNYLKQQNEELKKQIDLDRKRMREKAEEHSVMGGRGLGAGIAGGMGVDLPSVWDDTTNQIKTQAEFLKSIYGDVADFAGGAIGSMVDGLAQLGVNWLMTGEFSAQAALRMLAASAMHIAVEAAFKGVFELAEAAAAAARYDFISATLHKAAAGIYFKTAAIAGAVGVGAALVGRATGGGGGGGGAGGNGEQGAYGGGSGRQTPPEPFSRVSEDAYISGRRGGDSAMLRFVLEKLHDKLNAVPPGHVFMAGMRQNPGAVGQQVATDIGRNANIGRTILSKSGVR